MLVKNFRSIILVVVFMNTFLCATSTDSTYDDATQTVNNTITDVASKKGPFFPTGIWEDLDFSRFWKEVRITGNLRTCGIDDLKDGLFGFDAHMIEPALISEVVRDKWRLEFLQMNLNIGNRARNLAQQGTSRVDAHESTQGFLYSHLYQFPLFGTLFKDSFNGTFCFEEGTTGVVYLSELDPSANIDVYRYKLMPFAIEMMTEQGVVNAIAACIAAESFDNMDHGDKRVSSTGRTLMSIIDTFFYANGCKGMLPVGSRINHADPLAGLYNITAGNIHFISTTTPLLKQTMISSVNGYNKDMYCKPKYGPNMMIMSQYPMQIVRPRAGEVMEMGVTPARQTYFKNDMSTGDNSVAIVWQRRDYAMWAYKCGKSAQ